MPEKQKTKGGLLSFSFSTWLKIFLFVSGLVLGIAVQHYYIEPFVSNTFGEQLTSCFSEKQLLDMEINSCYVDLNNCRKACAQPAGSQLP